jgi:hypothetical protein
MKVLLIAIGWAIALALGTFFLIISSMAFSVSPEARMSQFTGYGAIIGIIGGITIGLVLLWSQSAIKLPYVLLFTLIWALSLIVGLRIGWHIIQPDFSSQAVSRGVIIGIAIGCILAGFFTALVLRQSGLLIQWSNVFFVTFGWALALLVGIGFIFTALNWNFIPMGLILVPIIGGLITGAIGGSVMFGQLR